MHERRVRRDENDRFAIRLDGTTRDMLRRQRQMQSAQGVKSTDLDTRLCMIEERDAAADERIAQMGLVQRSQSERLAGAEDRIAAGADALVTLQRETARTDQELAASIAEAARAIAKLSSDTAAALADIRASIAAVPRPTLLGIVTARYGGIASVGIAPRKVTLALGPAKAGDILIPRCIASVPAGFALGDVTCVANGQVEVTFVTPALTLLVTADIPIAVYAMRAA